MRHRYTEIELQYIRDHLHLTDKVIAKHIGRSRASVSFKRHLMGISKTKPYTTKDIRYISNNLDLTDKELAEELGRTENGIQYLRNRYHLVKYRKLTEMKLI